MGNNIERSIQRRISSLLLRYNSGAGGVLLTYSNMEYSEYNSGGIGKIWSEEPHIHFQVEVDTLVFGPCVGMKLTGIVNECFPSHVGMLVQSYFNAMIPSGLLMDSYEFKSSSQKWIKHKKDGDNNQQEIGINDEVTFQVVKLHECEGVISIEGKLLD